MIRRYPYEQVLGIGTLRNDTGSKCKTYLIILIPKKHRDYAGFRVLRRLLLPRAEYYIFTSPNVCLGLIPVGVSA